MVIKKGKTETEKTISEMKLPKWLDDLITKKWFLYVATAVVLVLLIGFSLPASTRDNIASTIFAKTSIDGMGTGPSGDAGNPPIIGAATPTPTPGQEKTMIASSDWQKKLEADKKDPILKRRISDYYSPRGEVLIPINSIPKEVRLYHQEYNVYIVNLAINNKGEMTGIIENRGVNTAKIETTSFILVRSDYTGIGIVMIKLGINPPSDGSVYIKAGESKSFMTAAPGFVPQEIEKHLDLPSMVFISPPVIVDGKNNLYGI